MFLVLSISSCSKLYTRPQNEDYKEIVSHITDIENNIPSEYLILCLGKPSLKGDSLDDVAIAVLKHSRRSEECKIRHNSFVEFYLGREEERKQ